MLFFLEREVPAFLRLLMLPTSEFLAIMTALKDSVRDYGLFLRETKRYKPLFEADTLDQQIDALARSEYATDSRYGEKSVAL